MDPREPSSALAALLGEFEARWYTQGYLKQTQHSLLRFFAYLRGRRVHDLRSVGEEHVIAYARQLAETKGAKGTPCSVASQRTYLSGVQRLFRFLVREGVLVEDPTLDLVLPHWKRLPRAVLNQAHARQLVGAPDPDTPRGKRDRAILELLYGTAIRVGECERLDVRDLDRGRGLLHIRLGKGGKDRVVPVVGRAAEAIDLYLNEARPSLARDPRETALFINRHGLRVRTRNIQDLVRMNAKAAGLDIRVTPHTLRHGCATHLLEGGANVREVQTLLGHKSVQTTAIYAKVAPDELARVVRKTHPRERARKPRKRRSGR